MPSPAELAILESVRAKAPATPAAPTVKMTKGSETIEVPESQHIDYLANGYEDSRFAEGGEFNPTLSGVAEHALAYGEAVDRGATGGLGGLAGSAIAAGVDTMMGSGIPRASAPGMNAPAAEAPSFGDNFAAAEAARRQRADALGMPGLALEGIGTIATLGAGTLAKGATMAGKPLLGMAAKALTMTPVALAEQLGTKAAAKVLGQQAAQSAMGKIGQTIVARGAGGLAEGAATGGLVTAVENVDTALENPWEAAQNVALGITFGGGSGMVLGGGTGLVEGASRAFGQHVIPAIEAAVKPRPPVPVARDLGVDEVIQANAARPMTAALLPDKSQGGAMDVLNEHRALTYGAAQAEEHGARALQHGLDEREQLRIYAAERLGMAQKRKVNEAALAQGFDQDLVGPDPDDVMRIRAIKDQADLAGQEMQAAQTAHEQALMRRQAAIDAEAAARQALDIAEGGTPPAARGIDTSAIVPNEKFSKDFPNGVRVDTFDLPGKGSVRIDSGETPGFATISQIQVEPAMARQGIGTSLYAKADEYARAKGLKLASDVQRAPAAESWWKKQVSAGNAEYSPDMDRYILNKPLSGAAPAPAAPGKKLSARELRPYREALATAKRDAKMAQKAFDGVDGDFRAKATRHAELSGQAAGAPTPRQMSRIEAESRDMFAGIKDSLKEMDGKFAGPEADVLQNFSRRVDDYEAKTMAAYRRGDFGDAHVLMDQGLKGALGDLVQHAKSGAVVEYGQQLYKVPQSFLENAKVWGPDIAGRNQLVNPTAHASMVAENDAGYRSLYQTVGLDGKGNFGNRKGANSAATASLLKQIGEQPAESTEVGSRRAWRAGVDDASNKFKAWGDPEDAGLVAAIAKNQTHLEDILDHTAMERRMAAKAKERMASWTMAATAGAGLGALGAATGTPELALVGLPMVSARWLLGTVAKYKGDLIQRSIQGAVKLVGTGAKYGEKVGRAGNQMYARKMGRQQREEALASSGNSREAAIAHAQAMQDMGSPVLGAAAEEAARTNALSPGLGDAILQHQLQVAKYVTDKLPKAPSPAVFSPRPRLSNAAATSLDRTLIAINGPAKTFERIIDKAATAEDLDAMRTLYPGPYKAMTDAIMAEVSKNPRRVKSPSLQMYLSRVTGQPLTPALMRLSTSQERAKKASQGAEDAGAPQGQGDNGSDGVTKRAPINIPTDPNEVYASRADSVMD